MPAKDDRTEAPRAGKILARWNVSGDAGSVPARWIDSGARCIHSGVRFLEHLDDSLVDLMIDIDLKQIFQWFSMIFNGFVQSVDRFADRFADRFDDLYGLLIFFNGFL